MTPGKLVAALCLLLACRTLHAQPGQRDLSGSVTDRHHEPLNGAVVQLQDDNTGSVITYITNRSGRYIFKRLSTDDDYHVFANFHDRRSRSRFLSKFDSHPTREIPLVVR